MKIRLQRFMADCGVASRRQCEALIAAGRVRVNDQVRTDVPVLIDPARDKITIDQQAIEPLHEQEKAYYLLNKPKGVLVTNYDPADRKTAAELMKGISERVFPVGRLEMDSRGALIMTNDGELANRLTHPRYGIEKTYIVEVEGKLTPAGIEKIRRGMWLGPEHRGKVVAERTERFSLKVVGRERGRTILEVKIAEGKNREIRRVMARVGNPVRDLNRVAIAGKVTLKGLPIGEFRRLTPQEVAWLYKASSKEYHEQQKTATQQWYEQKEMEKERKRLEREAGKPAPKARTTTETQRHRGRTETVRKEAPRRFEQPVRSPVTAKKPASVAHPLGEAAIRDDDF